MIKIIGKFYKLAANQTLRNNFCHLVFTRHLCSATGKGSCLLFRNKNTSKIKGNNNLASFRKRKYLTY